MSETQIKKTKFFDKMNKKYIKEMGIKMEEEPTTICDYCDSEKLEINIVEINRWSSTFTRNLCNSCIKHELKDEGIEFRIIGKVWK